MGVNSSTEHNVTRLEDIPSELEMRKDKLEEIGRYMSLIQFILFSLMFGASWCNFYNFFTSNTMTFIASLLCITASFVKLELSRLQRQNEDRAILRALECVKKQPGDRNSSILILFTEMSLRRNFEKWRASFETKIVDRIRENAFDYVLFFVEVIFPAWLVLTSLKDVHDSPSGHINSWKGFLDVNQTFYTLTTAGQFMESIEFLAIITSMLVSFYTCLPEDKKCLKLKDRLRKRPFLREKMEEMLKKATAPSTSDALPLTLPFRVTVPEQKPYESTVTVAEANSAETRVIVLDEKPPESRVSVAEANYAETRVTVLEEKRSEAKVTAPVEKSTESRVAGPEEKSTEFRFTAPEETPTESKVAGPEEKSTESKVTDPGEKPAEFGVADSEEKPDDKVDKFNFGSQDLY